MLDSNTSLIKSWIYWEIKYFIKYFSSSSQNHVDCTMCPLAKFIWLLFVSNNQMSAIPFNLISCDIWCTYHIATYDGNRYFLTIVYDSTKFTWSYLLKTKLEALLQLRLNMARLLSSWCQIIKMSSFDWFSTIVRNHKLVLICRKVK